MGQDVLVRSIWAVESGDYSDRMTHCVFTERALAEEYVTAVIAAERRYDTSVWGQPESDGYYEGRLRITELQLWDALPLVADASLSDQRHSRATR